MQIDGHELLFLCSFEAFRIDNIKVPTFNPKFFIYTLKLRKSSKGHKKPLHTPGICFAQLMMPTSSLSYSSLKVLVIWYSGSDKMDSWDARSISGSQDDSASSILFSVNSEEVTYTSGKTRGPSLAIHTVTKFYNYHQSGKWKAH